MCSKHGAGKSYLNCIGTSILINSNENDVLGSEPFRVHVLEV
jgi:hypothetical protein